MGDLVRGTPPKLRWNRGGVRSTKRAISLKRCEIGPKLLWRTNRKSHTRFRLAPTSMTLDDLERLQRRSCRNEKNYGAHQKNLNENRIVLSAAKYRPMIVSGNINCTRGGSTGEALSNDSNGHPASVNVNMCTYYLRPILCHLSTPFFARASVVDRNVTWVWMKKTKHIIF